MREKSLSIAGSHPALSPLNLVSQDLEQSSRTLAAADAHGDDDIFRAAALSLDQRMAGRARAGHAIRVANRDRAARDIEQLVGNAELVATVKHLHRERFVQLPQADIVHLEIV